MAPRAKTEAPVAADDIDLDSIDFDAWSEDDEQKAIEALAPDIRYVIVEKNFIGRFEDGVKVRLPLNMTLDDLDELTAKTDNPVDQVKILLEQMGGKKALTEFTRHNLPETITMARKFFDVFERVAGATLPES